MAPEQIRNAKHVDARADVWSLGACLYRLMTGALPYPGETELEIVEAILTREPIPIAKFRDHVSPAVEAIVLRCLRKDPGDRFASVAEMRAALEATRTQLLGSFGKTLRLPPPAPPSDPIPKAMPSAPASAPRPAAPAPSVPRSPGRALPLVLAVLGVVIVSAAAILGWYVGRR
jgi:serine/threonine-protein kinase